MLVNTVEDLKKLIKACRSMGVVSFKSNSIEFTLGDILPKTVRRPKKAKTSQLETPSIDEVLSPDFMSDEDLLFYSVTAPEQLDQGN